MEECCSNFKKATQSGSDNEQYASAIYRISYPIYEGYGIGIIDDKINFCPWCGKEK